MIQAHYFEPGALPGEGGGYPISQPILGRFIVAGGEPIFREIIHKLADRPRNILKVLFGELILWIIFTDNSQPNALPRDPGITKLPILFGPLSLPLHRSALG